MKIFCLSFLLIVTVGSSAFADGVYRLVYSKCNNGFLIVALTNTANYEKTKHDELVGVRRLVEFANDGSLTCQTDGGSVSVTVSDYYPASAKGMCGGIDSARFELTEIDQGRTVREAWIPWSHGGLCQNTDRQIRIGHGVFRICSAPAELNRQPTLLDMTGFDCIDLVERE